MLQGLQGGSCILRARGGSSVLEHTYLTGDLYSPRTRR